MNKQENFQSAVTVALRDREVARNEIFTQLRSLSVEERAKMPPETYARLSPEQFAILLGRPLPKISFEEAVAQQESITSTQHCDGSDAPSRDRRQKIGKVRSPLLRALRCAGIAWLCTGLPSVGAMAAAPYLTGLVPSPSRSTDAATWPQCARLGVNTDGCVYYIESALTWPQAAQLLDMPLPTLLAANRASGNVSLMQGSPLIVWRFRHPLSN
jgi:hypothetical protein